KSTDKGSDKKGPPAAEFELIGPFRIVSMGKKISRDLPETGGASSDLRDITFAVDASKLGVDKVDPQLAKLIQARLMQPGGSAPVAVVIHKLKPFKKK